MTDFHLSQPIEIKREAIGGTGEFSGWGSTFNTGPDRNGDVIMPGAFTRSLAAHRAAGTAPALLWGHDRSEPIGKLLEVTEKPDGLWIAGQLTLATRRGAEAHALMKDSVFAFSIGCFIEQETLGTDGVRRKIEIVDLIEVSAVALPANRDARLVSVKSAGDPASLALAIKTTNDRIKPLFEKARTR